MQLPRMLGKLALVAALLFAPVTLQATTVRRAPLDELVRDSHVIVRAHVSFIDDRAGEATGKFLTRIGFEVDEAIMGVTAGETMLELTFPGGKNGNLMSQIPGAPSFSAGQEVVMLVRRTPAGDTITGLTQGIFAVDRAGVVPRARRFDTGDMRVVDAQGRETNVERIDLPLADLMTRLATLSHEVVR